MLRIISQKLFLIFFAFVLVLPLFSPVIAVAEDVAPPERPQIYITEVQAGGEKDNGDLVAAKQEFVEIYNAGSSEVDVAGWILFYPTTSSTRLLTNFNENTLFQPGEVRVYAHSGYLEGSIPFAGTYNGSSGYLPQTGEIYLMDAASNEVDAVSWTSTKNKDNTLEAGESLQRCTIGGSIDLARGNDGFETNKSPTPGVLVECPAGGGGTDTEEPELPDGEDNGSSDPVEPESVFPTCEGAEISEILPNPAGSDTGREFIELHNPLDETIDFTGCALQVAGSNKTYSLDGVVLQPGEYRAFYNDTTGLSLPNAAGGTVWLLTPTEDEHEVTYAENMPDDTSWSLIDDVWQLTYALTPHAPNVAMPLKPCPVGQVRSEETGRCQSIIQTASASLTPCSPGQERNPLTNRCRSVAAATTALTPCKEGQERNPETNRCRAVASATTELKPCAADQYRNPETNRCKKVESASELVPCKEGQERNPETNRCRKIAASASDIETVKDVESKTQASRVSWWVTGSVAVAALGYGVYEWRQDIARRFTRVRQKFTR